MKAAGLTHGGFYGHFDSKEDLMAQACERAVDELLQAGETRRQEANDTPYIAFLKNYTPLVPLVTVVRKHYPYKVQIVGTAR